jgi:Raf kinase inhibitor-like YbhB/YbcL family protein
MIVSVFVRRLKEGRTFAEFRQVWEADLGFGVPIRVFNAVSLEDPRDVISSVFGPPPCGWAYRPVSLGGVSLTLRATAFASDAPIPARYDHDHGDTSPDLTWDDVPAGTVELVLLVDDPDAPIEGSFVHWVLYGIDPARTELAEGESPAEARSGANGFGQPGYVGPAPPPGDAPHHYMFRLLAVDQPTNLAGLPSYQDVDAACVGHTLAEAKLMGTYQR